MFSPPLPNDLLDQIERLLELYDGIMQLLSCFVIEVAGGLNALGDLRETGVDIAEQAVLQGLDIAYLDIVQQAIYNRIDNDNLMLLRLMGELLVLLEHFHDTFTHWPDAPWYRASRSEPNWEKALQFTVLRIRAALSEPATFFMALI